jgi:DNA-binding transcriptional LysR family regulator
MGESYSTDTAMNAITLRQLQYFIAVAEDEHFTRASERLLVAQPSLSRQIKDLEGVLGVELFSRDGRGARLTEAGRELLSCARTVRAMLERTIDSVRATAEGDSGCLRLGYWGPTFYNNPITRAAFERFRAEAPGVDVISQELFSEQMVPALRDGRVDMAITRPIPRIADIESYFISVERFVVLLPRGDILAKQSSVALSDLSERGLITCPSQLALSFNRRVEEIVAQSRVSLHVVREVSQLSSIAYHVSRGEGVALMPASVGGVAFSGVEIREISDGNASIDIVALTRRREESASVLRFLEYLSCAARQAAHIHA